MPLPLFIPPTMQGKKLVLSESAIHRALVRIAHEIAERNDQSSDVILIGIQKGGTHLAARLGAFLAKIWSHSVPIGAIDVSMHRDDFSAQIPGQVHPTTLPCDITGKTVVLVDDVLYSGRTTRAALDALTDYGRPKSVQLAVLVDRGNRELPIRADFIGKNVSTHPKERINVSLTEEGGEDAVHLVAL